MQPEKYVYSAIAQDGTTRVFNGNEKFADVVNKLGEGQLYRFKAVMSGTQIVPETQVDIFTVSFFSTVIALFIGALIFFNQSKSPSKDNNSDTTQNNILRYNEHSLG